MNCKCMSDDCPNPDWDNHWIVPESELTEEEKDVSRVIYTPEEFIKYLSNKSEDKS